MLWVCAENADAGEMNGRKLGILEEKAGVPIIWYESIHIDDGDRRLKPGEFNGVRTVAHVALGAPAILIANKMYGVDTVILGLMNAAARGGVFGARRAAGSSHHEFPEYVVVDFAGQSGRPIFHGEGLVKWAPVPSLDAIGETEKNASRISVSLILRWDISIAKSQGWLWRRS